MGRGGCGPVWGPGESDAQGTVEYAVVLVALITIVIALAALWRAGERGVFVDLAAGAASHGLDADGAVDIALY